MVPIDSSQTHESFPPINLMIGSLVEENRRKNQSVEIRVHTIGKYANLVPSPTVSFKSVISSFPLVFLPSIFSRVTIQSLNFQSLTVLAQINFPVSTNWPGGYEGLISMRFKSRNRSSGHPTRFIGGLVKGGKFLDLII